MIVKSECLSSYILSGSLKQPDQRLPLPPTKLSYLKLFVILCKNPRRSAVYEILMAYPVPTTMFIIKVTEILMFDVSIH